MRRVSCIASIAKGPMLLNSLLRSRTMLTASSAWKANQHYATSCVVFGTHMWLSPKLSTAVVRLTRNVTDIPHFTAMNRVLVH